MEYDGECELCGEPEEEIDPLGHFVAPKMPNGYVMAHGQCGEDANLKLA